MIRQIRCFGPRTEGSETSIGMWVRPDTTDEGICRDIIERDPYGLFKASKRIKYGLLARLHPAVFDIGANIGAFSRLAFNVWPDCWVKAYEPHPLNYGLMKLNLRGKKYDSAMAAVYGEKLPQSVLVERKEDERNQFGGWGVSQVKHDYWPDFDNEVGVPCDLESVSDLNSDILSGGLWRPIVLKLDCEGAEFSILQSLPESTLNKIALIVGEFHCHALTMDYMERFKWEKIRSKVLQYFDCEEIESRPDHNGEAFTFTALSRELTTYEAGA